MIQEDINTYKTINIERSNEIIPESQYDKVISAYSIFESEMEKCSNYRITATISPIMTNVLPSRLTDIIRLSDGLHLTGQSRIDAIQTINDEDYEYRIGYDIFDNHYNRVDTFKTGNTLNDFTGITLSNVLTFPNSISSNLIEENGWLLIKNKTKINDNRMFKTKNPLENIDLFPTRDYFLFNNIIVNKKNKKNWTFNLTYPYQNFFDSNLINDQNGLNGIPIINSEIIIENSNRLLKITTLYDNNIKQNDIIKLKRNDKNTNKTYLVYDIENKNTLYINLEKYSDLLNIDDYKSMRVCKVVENYDCKYYIRKFRKLPNYQENDFLIHEDNIYDNIDNISTEFSNEEYRLAFSKTIFNDPVYQIQYTDDINIGLLKDNLQRPISELYLTVIKKNISDSIEEPSAIFTSVTSGIETDLTLTGYSNIRLLNNDTPLEKNITNTGSTLFNDLENKNIYLGDVVEYDPKNVNETVLCDIKHRFNVIERENESELKYYDIYSDNVNILDNTSFLNGTNQWFPTNDGSLSSIISEFYPLANKLFVMGGHATSGCYTNIQRPLLKNKIYFLSGYAKTHYNNTNMDLRISIDNNIDLLSQEITINDEWLYFNLTLTGDGKYHKLMIENADNNNISFYVSKIKLEMNSLSDWTTNPIDQDGEYKFTLATQKIQANNEGYFYKPHYLIKLKNFSDEIKYSEFNEIKKCGNFESGVTINNEVKLLSNVTKNDLKYILMKIDDTFTIADSSYVRIIKNDDFTNVKIKIFNEATNIILIPYVSIMGEIEDININNLKFKVFKDESIPLYCQDLDDNTCRWRDILKNGYNNIEQSDELVFTNNAFYVHKNINFYLKRQDPFGKYGLRSKTFPSDVFGVAEKNTFPSNNLIRKNNLLC